MANKLKKLLRKGLRAAVVACAVSLACASCQKVCRCYAYDGTLVDFSQEDLSQMGHTCSGMENTDFGLVYSMCEWKN
ncbi:MAG: hypothetical protein SPJ13_01535 [Bacteroidales bacterium]|nr:hypothetical protein [Bacteroidales bacterium]